MMNLSELTKMFEQKQISRRQFVTQLSALGGNHGPDAVVFIRKKPWPRPRVRAVPSARP